MADGDDRERLIKDEEESAMPVGANPVNSTRSDFGNVGSTIPPSTGLRNDSDRTNRVSEVIPKNGNVIPYSDRTTELPTRDGSINYPEVSDSVDTPMTDEVSTESTPKPKITIRQKLTFLGVALTYMSSLMSFSVLAPFFPYEAQKKGVAPTETGFVFGLFALINFLSAPLFGKYLPVIGGKFLFLSGSFVAAGCNILFGVLDEIEQEEVFLIYCFVIRAVEALGSSASITAGMAIIANVFPDNVGQMGGMLEIFSGLGFAVGPPLGSLLYGIGGYKLPFLVLGGACMAVAVANIFILPSLGSDDGKQKSGSVISVLKIPAVWIVCCACAWGSASLGFGDPTLSLHLTGPDFNVHPSMVGYLYLLIGGTYGVTAPFWGYLADKKKATRFMMAIGFWLTGVSFLLLGPSPVLNLPNDLWIIILSLGLMGFAIGCALMPAFLDLLMSTKWYGLPDDIATQAVVSGLFNGSFSFGTFLGPTVAGVLVDHLGFDWSVTIFGGGNFVMMIVICLFGVWEFQCGKGRRKPKSARSHQNPDTLDDTAPLAVDA